jgi:hypothetical protein
VVEPGRSLTRREFDDVIRRASELAARESDAGEGSLSEAELLRIAGEVGLSERHVRAALAEVRTGSALMVGTGGTLDRLFGPLVVRASRVVPGHPRELADVLDAFLVGGQLLQSVRRSDYFLQYRPAVDWASQIARAASAASRRYYIAAARSVEVRLEPIDAARTLVDLAIDPGTRGDAIGGATAGTVVGAVAGAGATVALLTAAPLTLAVAGGVALAAAFTGGSISLAGHIHRRKLRDVQSELEGVLDRLESEESLEPPPPAWRQWVKRQFHGVAKDILSSRGPQR